jgi:broad specificity phosphatase PhoE
MVSHYRPTLHQRLASAGFDIDKAKIGNSGLRRARETAQLLFPGRTLEHLPHIKERGNIPENTPSRTRRCKPDWPAFLRHIYGLPQNQFAVVGHGSFLRSEAWKSISNKPHGRFNNLDGFLVTGILTSDGNIINPHVEELKYNPPIYIKNAIDECKGLDKKIVAKYTRRAHRFKKSTTRKH